MLLRYLFPQLLLCFVAAASPCKANLIEVNFAGSAGGIAPYDDKEGNYHLNGFSTTFTARYFFDTSVSTVVETTPGVYWLTGLASGSITLAAIGGNPSYGNGPYTFGVFGDGTLESWSQSSEQSFRVDRWSLCPG
jgi:hypothetical protein